ncbi:MAG: hypothetical protein MUC93_09075, partial [Bacteroidales bacterium]|nr:hypothetical protein [Bacteroidales bacterium]
MINVINFMSSDRTFKKLKKNKLKTHFKGFSKSHVLTPSFAKLRYPPLYGVYPLYTSFTISKIITGQGGDSSFIRLAADSFGMTV